MFQIQFTFEFHEYSNRNLSQSTVCFIENSKKEWFFIKFTNVSEIRLKSKQNIEKMTASFKKKAEAANFEHYVENRGEISVKITKNYLFLKSKI